MSYRHRWPAFARHWDEGVAVGYAGLEAALIQGAIAFMESEPPALGGPIRVTNVGEAIQALTVNRLAVTGIGKRASTSSAQMEAGLTPSPISSTRAADDRAPRLDFHRQLVALNRDSGGAMAWVLMS